MWRRHHDAALIGADHESVIFWSMLAWALVPAAVAVATYRSRSIAPPLAMSPGETFPTTSLQRLIAPLPRTSGRTRRKAA